MSFAQYRWRCPACQHNNMREQAVCWHCTHAAVPHRILRAPLTRRKSTRLRNGLLGGLALLLLGPIAWVAGHRGAAGPVALQVQWISRHTRGAGEVLPGYEGTTITAEITNVSGQALDRVRCSAYAERLAGFSGSGLEVETWGVWSRPPNPANPEPSGPNMLVSISLAPGEALRCSFRSQNPLAFPSVPVKLRAWTGDGSVLDIAQTR